MPECHVCGEETDAETGFVCNDCGEFTCNMCGDGDLCDLCIGDEVFLADILDLEGEIQDENNRLA